MFHRTYFSYLIKTCSQRTYLLKMLRSQGLTLNQLSCVYHAFVVSLISYPLPAWGFFLATGQYVKINDF